MTARDLIAAALDNLASRPGFVERADQRQLALLIGDCIAGAKSGLFEAPTGLGKSLAALIPAIAFAIAEGKRTVIATYTNVLAEQYWRSDLPLALSLFEGEPPSTQFLIGRQRYGCMQAMSENAPELLKTFGKDAELGIESEFRAITKLRGNELMSKWRSASVPPVCPSRLCPKYDSCFYYKARRAASQALVVITNHSVVLQDAILRDVSEGDVTMLGSYDFLVVDEAHDFPQAALNAFEFELSENKIAVMQGITNKLEQSVLPISAETGGTATFLATCEKFRSELSKRQLDLKALALTSGRGGILTATPSDVWEHPAVRSRAMPDVSRAQGVADDTAKSVDDFLGAMNRAFGDWKGDAGKELAEDAKEAIHNYVMYLTEFAWGCRRLFEPRGVSVSHLMTDGNGVTLRNETIGIAEPLQRMVWEVVPTVCMSATLALDGDFGFFKRVTGAEPSFAEVLPSPFDYKSQVALYLPNAGDVPDPAAARKEGAEEIYFDAIAKQVSALIQACGGRTLALFHSRREMEEVFTRVNIPEELPIYMQRRSGVSTVGERFRKDVRSSLFALRSFWTGFDAPGETLSCVILVRVPFEVPIDPPQLARQAWMQSQGLDPFIAYTLPISKMMMRQGAGRLIRRSEDKGVIALLDPRLKTKGYGDEILRNLPEMRSFADVGEAAAFVGIWEACRLETAD